MTNGSLRKVASIAECSRAFCNSFDLNLAIIGLENQVSVFFRVAVLHRFSVPQSSSEAYDETLPIPTICVCTACDRLRLAERISKVRPLKSVSNYVLAV